jgi:hypothetical protein
VLSGEATHTNFTVFDLTRSGFKPMIYRTRGKHEHYTTDAVEKYGNHYIPNYKWKQIIA